METGRREKAQCQGGQLDGNKAVVDGNAVDPHAEQYSLSPSLHTYTHTQKTYNTHTLTVTSEGIVNEQWPQALGSIGPSKRKLFMASKLIVCCNNCLLGQACRWTAWLVLPPVATGGPAADCSSSEEKCRERERERGTA